MKDFLKKIQKILESRKKFFIIIFSSWFIFIIIIGVIIGLTKKPDIVPLTPEEENAKILNDIKDDDKKILQGEMLSTGNNLSFEELQRSRNYVESRKNKR